MRALTLAAALLAVYAGADGPTATRKGDRDALVALWEENGRQPSMVDWGQEDPCIGPIGPAGSANSQGFNHWKGVACTPCTGDGSEYCVSQIWLHEKGLNGTIPSGFRDLPELRILFLNGNNLTGPVDGTMFGSMPKLEAVKLDHNEFNGSVPMTALVSLKQLRLLDVSQNKFEGIDFELTKKMRRRIRSAREAERVTAEMASDKIGFIDMSYNRKLNGEFPKAFGYLPKLRTLQIHDTNLTGRVVTGPYSWAGKAEIILLSGNGALCGSRPSVCATRGTWCDIEEDFGPCDDDDDDDDGEKLTVTLGSPKVGFHLAALGVSSLLLERLGYDVTRVDTLPHPDLYPHFTGAGGADVYIDAVVSADLPYNHAPWLADFAPSFNVVGTTNELTGIFVAAPAYTLAKMAREGLTTIEDVRKLELGELLSYDFGACPACSNLAQALTADGGALEGYRQVDLDEELLMAAVAQRLKKEEDFVTTWYSPTYHETQFPQLHKVDGALRRGGTAYPGANQGKTLVRKDAVPKFDDAGRNVLGAVFPGNDALRAMSARIANGSSYLQAAAEWLDSHERLVDAWLWGTNATSSPPFSACLRV